MSDLVHLKIWDDPAIPDALSWYLDVVENRRPAKFRIAATVVTQIDPVASNEETPDGGGAIDPIEPAAPFHAIPYVSSPISDWAAIPLSFGNAL